MRLKLNFVFLILAFLVLPSVNAAVGVSPASHRVDFTPELKQVFSFEFFNDGATEMEVFAQGDLAEYVELSSKKISSYGGVNVLLKLPKEIEVPGTHTIYITAKQVASEENGFGIIGGIKGLIHVVVPYPGQYLIATLSSPNAKAGEPVYFSTKLNNLGNENVHVNGKISVYRNDTFITSIELGEFEMTSPEEKVIESVLETQNYLPGTYRAELQVWYGDSNLAQAESNFRLGELKLQIINYTKEFNRDSINPIEVEVESNWNDPIDGVYANITIQGYPMSFLTPSASINGFEKVKLKGFFDTTGIINDTFSGLIQVHYSGKVEQQIVDFRFNKEIDYVIIGLIVAAIVILILVLFVTYALRRVEKKNEKGKKTK